MRLVVCDIVNSMYGVKFLGEIIRPQELFARKNLRIIFEKLVHTSIMRLNPVSMDKLYDLMTMAVKHQITFCAKVSANVINAQDINGQRMKVSAKAVVFKELKAR